MTLKSIALVGYMGAGKGAVADLLVNRGFLPFSGGDVLRGISQGYRSNERMPLIELGNKVRREFGADFLVRVGKLLIEDSPPGSRFVFDSLRNPAEVEYLEKELGALVIEVRAPLGVRFRRVRDRKKPGDPETWEEFMKIERIDHGVGQPESGQNISGCVRLAEKFINNEGDINDPEFREKLEVRLDQILARNGFIEGNSRSKER